MEQSAWSRCAYFQLRVTKIHFNKAHDLPHSSPLPPVLHPSSYSSTQACQVSRPSSPSRTPQVETVPSPRNFLSWAKLVPLWWSTIFPLGNSSILKSHELMGKTLTTFFGGFPHGSVVKNLAASTGDAGLIPELGRSPGDANGNSLQYSFLENPIDRVVRSAIVRGSQRVRHSTWAHTLSYWTLELLLALCYNNA